METSNPKSSEIKELKARKIALKQEMEQIQSEIESSLNEVRNSVADKTRLRYWVEKYPLHLLGSTLIAGFVLARKGGGKGGGSSNGNAPDVSVETESSRNSFLSLFMDELKKLVTQRAVRALMQRIEDAIDERKSQEK